MNTNITMPTGLMKIINNATWERVAVGWTDAQVLWLMKHFNEVSSPKISHSSYLKIQK